MVYIVIILYLCYMIRVKPKNSDYEKMILNTGNMNLNKNIIIHRAEDRGYADHGWLKANHSFSFAGWYNPAKIHFGVLRVLNDDHIAPNTGFPTHPHDNMEIITIPLKGAVYHEDNMGHSGEVHAGEIQVMSAGKGVMHSEYNKGDVELNLFQIWLFPSTRNVEPRYDQMKIDERSLSNNFIQLVSPDKEDEGVWIHQNAWISKGQVDKEREINYQLKSDENGVYIMVIDGEVEIEGEIIRRRDAIGITGIQKINITGLSDSEVLILDVPMNIEKYA